MPQPNKPPAACGFATTRRRHELTERRIRQARRLHKPGGHSSVCNVSALVPRHRGRPLLQIERQYDVVADLGAVPAEEGAEAPGAAVFRGQRADLAAVGVDELEPAVDHLRSAAGMVMTAYVLAAFESR